jgi:hypothetical protein
MKIVLQHKQTLQYLRANNTWARSDADARDFQHSQAAIDFAYENDLLDVYIALKFPGGDSDAVPLPTRRSPVAAA